jgi:epoxide hydrolase-like predicted phosphatase
MSYRAVLFDLGGVVLGSPIHAIHRYELHIGLEKDSINRVVAATAPHGAWSKLERGELRMEEFYAAFEADCRQAGHEISASTMFEWMAEESQPRAAMLTAIGAIRTHGLRAGALTNNWVTGEDRAGPGDPTGKLRALFDVFIESSVEGIRKPDPQIYRLACQRLGVEPQEAVFLDDIGANLKPARELGLTTIKVEDPATALESLAQILDFSLDEPAGRPS